MKINILTVKSDDMDQHYITSQVVTWQENGDVTCGDYGNDVAKY